MTLFIARFVSPSPIHNVRLKFDRRLADFFANSHFKLNIWFHF